MTLRSSGGVCVMGCMLPLHDAGSDPFGGITASKWVRGIDQLARAAFSELADAVDDGVVVGADELSKAGVDDLGALGALARDEDLQAERGRLLLHAARVGDDGPGAIKKVDEVRVLERRKQVHVGSVAEVVENV